MGLKNLKRKIGEAVARLIFSAVSPLDRRIAEAHALSNLQFNLQISGYNHHLFPGDYAARSTLLLEMFRFLENRRPESILECGTGESTGLLVHYARRNPNARIVSLEDHEKWSELILTRFCQEEKPRNFELIQAPLGRIGARHGGVQIWYDSEAVRGAMADKKYEMVLIDGPSGRSPGGRGGIMNYLPESLAEEFVIYFDDSSSSLFREDVLALQKVLASSGRKFLCKSLYGQKEVYIFVTLGLSELVNGEVVAGFNLT